MDPHQKVSSDEMKEMKSLGMEDASMVLNHTVPAAVSAGPAGTGTILLLNSPNGPTHKRKNTSFKITNILPSRPPSNDPEESGEDDPDDSHTEDISDGQDMAPWSPSYNQPSRKLLSSMRRNSFDAAAAAAAACVAAGGTKEAAVSILSSNGLPASAMSVVLNEEVPVFSKNAKWVSSILTVAHAPHPHDARVGPRDRFKVVRMETNVPLKRGRWTCIDYIDKRTANVEKPNELNDNNGEVVEEDRLLPPLTSANVPSSSVSLCNNSIAEPVRMSSNPTTPSVVQSPSSGHPPPVYSNSSSSQQQMLQHIYQKAAAPQTQQQQVIQFAAAGPKQQPQTASILLPQNSTNLVSSSAGSAGPVPSPQMSVHQHQQQIFLEGAPSASYITPVSFSAGLLPSSSAVSSIPPSRAETTEMLPPASSFYPAHFDHPIDNEHLVERLEEISTQQNAPNSVEEDIDNSCEIQNNGGGSIKARDGNHYAAPPAAISSSNHPSYQQHGHHQHHQQQQQRYMPRPELGTGHIPPPGHSRYTSRGVSPTKDHQQHSSSLFASIYSASGTNQGAIDNRIEQAMDLVKSHLMNAVRSEVEELKERIVKLEDVISHLQNENDYLKANVTQEVLTQLPPPTSHHQILQQGPHNASSGGGGLSPTSSTLVVANQPASQQQQQQ